MNLALIGMPGCGKSTVGRILARHLDATFVDADTEIELRTIPRTADFEPGFFKPLPIDLDRWRR